MLCEADQFLIYPNKERILLKGWSGESPDGKDFTYIVPSDGTGASLYTRDEALKVNRKQLEDSIKEIVIKVGGRVVDRVSVYGQDGVSLRTNHEIVRAAEFPLGANLVVCEFKTKDGKTYNATAAVEILDNKPQFIGVDGNFAALHQ